MNDLFVDDILIDDLIVQFASELLTDYAWLEILEGPFKPCAGVQSIDMVASFLRFL